MRRLQTKTNVQAPNADFTFGRVKNNTGIANGTPLNEALLGDLMLFAEWLMDRGGITANGNPDSDLHGYQLGEALQSLIAKGAPGDSHGAWTTGTTLVIIGDATVTVDPGDIKINKYKIFGKTFIWRVQVQGATLSGGNTAIDFQIPAEIVTGGNQLRPLSGLVTGIYNNSTPMYLNIGTDAIGTKKTVTAQLAASAAFTNGTNNQNFDFTIIAELA